MIRDSWWLRYQKWLWGILLIGMTVAAYLPATHCGFIWDDDVYVTNNLLLTSPDGLRRIWFSLDSPSQYFPLVYTTFRFERSLWGLNPAGYHWVNILLHAANALLVWRLLVRLKAPGAWLAAGIFALHPVHVESVAWITERKNVLMLFFFLLALLAWIEFLETRWRRPWVIYLLTIICYVLSLFSKTTACTFPAAMLLVVWVKEIPINRLRLIQVLPFVVLGIGMGSLSIWWERVHQGTYGELFAFSTPERILIATHAVWFYVGKLIWPVNLIFSYPRWTLAPGSPLSYGWLGAGVVLFVILFILRKDLGRSALAGVIFFVAVLTPTLGFVALYTFRYSFVADHYQYVASIGLIALASAMIVKTSGVLTKTGSFLQPALGATLLMFLSVLTTRQCFAYRNAETLYRTTIERNPESVLARNNLGNLLLQKGRVTEAIDQYQRVLQIDPNFAESHNNLCYISLQKGDAGGAVAQCERALKIDPNYAVARNNLGNALRRLGKRRQALAEYERALALQPLSVECQNNIALVLSTSPEASLRNGAKAISFAQRASELAQENNPHVLGTLAAAYAEAGRFAEAIRVAKRGWALANSQDDAVLMQQLESDLKLYQANMPLRIPATSDNSSETQ